MRGELGWTRGVTVGWGLLMTWFIAQSVLGYAIALGLDTQVFAWHQDRVASALWGEVGFDPRTSAYRHWIQALLGGTLTSWAVGMLALVAIPLRSGERWAWFTVVASLLSWFGIDTWRSASDGVWVNVAFNLCGLGIPGLGLALVWPGLAKAPPSEGQDP